jgi:hypothetical protein
LIEGNEVLRLIASAFRLNYKIKSRAYGKSEYLHSRTSEEIVYLSLFNLDSEALLRHVLGLLARSRLRENPCLTIPESRHLKSIRNKLVNQVKDAV